MHSHPELQYRWWPVSSHSPPPDWVRLFDRFQSPRIAGRLGPRAAQYIASVRAKDGHGPTFTELFAELGVDVSSLTDPPRDIPTHIRRSLRGRLLLGLALALHGRGWIRWSTEPRSLDVGPRYHPGRSAPQKPTQ